MLFLVKIVMRIALGAACRVPVPVPSLCPLPSQEGKTAMHIATGWAARREDDMAGIVDFLDKAHPDLAEIQDEVRQRPRL